MINTSSLAPSVALYKRPSSSSRRAFLYKYKNFVCTSSLPSSLFVFLFTHPVYPDKHLCGFIFQSHSLTTNKSSRTTIKHQPTNQHGRELSWWAAKCEISFRWQTAAGMWTRQTTTTYWRRTTEVATGEEMLFQLLLWCYLTVLCKLYCADKFSLRPSSPTKAPVSVNEQNIWWATKCSSSSSSVHVLD